MEFMTQLPSILLEGVTGGINSIVSIAMIVFPLMILIEFARAYKIMDKISKGLSPITKLFNISDSAAFPLSIGLVFGLAYGSGVIIQSAKEGEIDKRSLVLVSIFLALCHAVVEDTLIFVAVNANGWFLLFIRVFAAFLITFVVSRTVKLSYKEDEGQFEDCNCHGKKRVQQ